MEDLRELVREGGTAVVQIDTTVEEMATVLPTLVAATPGPAHDPARGAGTYALVTGTSVVLNR